MDDNSVGTSAPEGDLSPIPAHLAHVSEGRRAGLETMNAGKPLAALQGNTEPILSRLREGETAKAIAASLGISHVALYEWLLAHCPEQWNAISSGRSLARIEVAETDLDAAEDNVQISKARESARLAQWSLERTARRAYGDSKADAGGVTVQVLIQRDGVTTNVLSND